VEYRCGAKAANELDGFIARRPVDCLPVSLDQYRRTVAACSVDGVDLADWASAQWPQRSIGLLTRRASMMALSVRLSTPGEACGLGATSSRGWFRACLRQGGRPVTVRTMRTRIRDSANLVCVD